MKYTEEFKKQLVKKVLSPGIVMTEIARKLKMSTDTIVRWKKQYGEEMKAAVVQIDIDPLLSGLNCQ